MMLQVGNLSTFYVKIGIIPTNQNKPHISTTEFGRNYREPLA